MRIYRAILVVAALLAVAAIVPNTPEKLVYFNGTAVSVSPK